jgi:hypothetical protein
MAVDEDVIRGVDLALAGDWDSAHAIAQAHEGVAVADWLHAVLHRIEGDEGNARYWYRQAGRAADAYADPINELAAIRAGLVPRGG